MLKKIFSIIKETLLNFNPGMIAFIAHRVSGIGITVFLFLHLKTLSAVTHTNSEEAFNAAMDKYNNLPGHIMEYLLLVAVVVHTINGIRIIIADFLGLTSAQKKMAYWSLAITVAILLFSIPFFFPEIHIF